MVGSEFQTENNNNRSQIEMSVAGSRQRMTVVGGDLQTENDSCRREQHWWASDGEQ